MYFKGKEKRLCLAATEAVRIAYLRYGKEKDGEILSVRLSPSVDEASLRTDTPKASGGARLFTKEYPFDDVTLSLVGAAFPSEEHPKTLSFRIETNQNPEHIDAASLKYIRGVGFLLAYLADSEGDISLCFDINSAVYGKRVSLSEKPAKKELSLFFNKVIDALKADASLMLDRVLNRLPTLDKMPFPYADVRAGQRDMMRAVRSAARRGETLFATAPTGTGKTMAALFPSLRALGAREVDKVFYLTPKTTSAKAALDAVALLADGGARLRAVQIGAKERLCAYRRENGSCRGCPNKNGKKAISTATYALIEEGKAAVFEEDILRVSKNEGVCPHELALDYSLYADVIVCDYNYLFDPRARLVRYFESGGDYMLLVDEAHNLPDRAREMYSASLSGDELALLRELFSDSLRLSEVADRLRGAFEKTVDGLLSGEIRTDEEGKTLGFAYTASLPVRFIEVLRKCADVFSKEIRGHKGEETELDKQRRECVYHLMEVCDKADSYDEHFLTYAVREGEGRTLHLFCADPSSLIGECLDKGRAAVFFSATLSPLSYYRSVLCGQRAAQTIEVPSPFESDALCLGAVDSVSVRASAREDTLPEIARLIISAMRARRGNYMVFCPSFSYMERVAEAFHRLTPKTPMIKQKRTMSQKERAAFLNAFSADNKGYFVGFCVTGGIYAEGVDLVGERLIGAIIIGMGLPGVSAEREMIAAYYEDATEEGKGYAYFYPALNRIMQAAGRVIRTENDRGVVVLIDDRLRDPALREMFPAAWRRLKYLPDRDALSAYIARFWERVDEEE